MGNGDNVPLWLIYRVNWSAKNRGTSTSTCNRPGNYNYKIWYMLHSDHTTVAQKNIGLAKKFESKLKTLKSGMICGQKSHFGSFQRVFCSLLHIGLYFGLAHPLLAILLDICHVLSIPNLPLCNFGHLKFEDMNLF